METPRVGSCRGPRRQSTRSGLPDGQPYGRVSPRKYLLAMPR